MTDDTALTIASIVMFATGHVIAGSVLIVLVGLVAWAESRD
jgi:hypothetical protein